jgi:DNA-directed RNA polymerase specialized sigma24 family protein
MICDVIFLSVADWPHSMRQSSQAVSCISEQLTRDGRNEKLKLHSCDNAHMTNTDENDEALIGRYALGDAAAFDQLYRRHELRTWRYLERNVCNQAKSDELLQEMWFTLARNTASLESVTRFRTRLFTLAHDRMTDSLRTQAAQASPAATASRPAGARDPVNALAQAIGQLPREQREAYLLHIEGELGVGDIAAITDNTIDTAQSRLRLAILKLHELLNEKTSEVQQSQDQLSEVDHLYRRLSALDPGRPGEWVRRKVQAYATQQAAERAVRASAKARESSSSAASTPRSTPIPTAAQQTANKPWLLPVTFGAIAVAALVGFLVVPRLMTSRHTSMATLPPAPVSQPETATPQAAQASTPRSSESASSAPPSPPLQSSEQKFPTSPPPASQSPVTTSLAPPTVAPRSSAPPAAVVASGSAGTSRPQSLTKARVARQSAAAPQSAPIASDRVETTTQAAWPAPPADAAHAPQSEPAPSTDTQVASAPPPPAATPSATQPAPPSVSTPAAAASNPPEDLCRAAESGDMSRLRAALAGDVDVNSRDANGHTALILAIQHNRVAIVRELLAHGANPNTADSHGNTPARAARARDSWAIIMELERSVRH